MKEVRRADRPRGPEKYPHWHDSPAWARRATLTRSKFLTMTPEEFHDWCMDNYREGTKAFFYALRWPEGYGYWVSREWTIETCYMGLAEHPEGWPTPLLT